MRPIMTLVKYVLLKNIRNTSDFFLQMMVFPIALIFILGISLAPAFEHHTMSPTVVGYFNEDNGPLSLHFEEFLNDPEIRDFLTIHPVEAKDQGLELLQKGNLSALVHLEGELSKKVTTSEQLPISITGHPYRELRVTIVENIVESFISGANTLYAMSSIGIEEPEYVIYQSNLIQEYPVSSSDLRPSSMDYYAITMLVMFIMYGALYSSFGMSDSYLTEVGQRIKTTPIHPREHYIGLMLANVLTSYFQVLVILTFTRYVFEVNWGHNIAMILLISFVFVVLAMGLGMMVTMVVKDKMQSSNLINFFVLFSTFIASGFMPINLHGLLSYLTYLSPNYYAQTALFNTIYHGPTHQTMIMLVVMVVMIIGCFLVTMVAERRSLQ